MEKGLNVQEIFKIIPEEVLEEFAKKTEVDKNVKKLTGKSIFQLLLFSYIQSERVSLRLMENYYQTEQFRSFLTENKGGTKHTSLSDRFRTIKTEYFETILSYLVEKVKQLKLTQEAQQIMRFDSTLITLSSKLLKHGLPTGAGGKKRQIKVTVGFNGLPRKIKVFEDNSSVGSEEVALKAAILEYSAKADGIVVFDRGLGSRKTFRQLDEEEIQFVTRLNNKARYKEVGSFSECSGKVVGNLTLEKDIEVQLGAKATRWLPHKLRLIIGTSPTGETFYFLTNIKDLTAEEITEIYKKRWDIEVFFRFIKQELNAKHFISRDLNGIKVTISMIMILAIMLLIYKLSNNIKGYKVVKIRFKNELEMEIIKDIIVFCGGDPERLKERWQKVNL